MILTEATGSVRSQPELTEAEGMILFAFRSFSVYFQIALSGCKFNTGIMRQDSLKK